MSMPNIPPQGDIVSPSGFADADALNDWNRDAIAYCVANGYITGKPKEGTVFLAPNDVLTRAESAAILWRSGIH